MMDLMVSKSVEDAPSDGKREAGEPSGSSVRGGTSSEVTKPRRRSFTQSYKLQILRKADSCRKPGELGALLRREALYSSHLTKWREQRDEGTLTRGTANKRGPKPDPDKRAAREIEKLRRESARLRRKLERAELIIEYQKKVADLLGIPLDEDESGSNKGAS